MFFASLNHDPSHVHFEKLAWTVLIRGGILNIKIIKKSDDQRGHTKLI